MELHDIKEEYAMNAHKKAMLLWPKYLEEGNFKKIENLATEDCVQHMPDGTDIHGIKRIIEMDKKFWMAFPDMKYEITSQIAEGDEACARGILTGTHKGAYSGIEPTNRKVKVPLIWMCKFTPQGKIKESWEEFDNATLINQITRH